MSTTWTTDADESITVTAGSSSTSNSWTTQANTKGTIATADSAGDVTITGTLDVSGATTLSSTLSTSGATTLSSTLGVTGATTLSSTLGVTGLVTATAGLKLGNNIIYASDGGQTITLDTSDNVTVLGDLTVTGNKITFGNGETIDNDTDGTIALTSPAISVGATTGNSNLAISSENDADTKLSFVEGGTLRWSMGLDGSDNSDYKLHFDYGNATVAGASKLNLDSSGNLTVAGGINSTGDVTLTGVSNTADSPKLKLLGSHNGADGPIIELSHVSSDSSEANSDKLGRIQFTGQDSANNATTYAEIITTIDDVASDTESGAFQMKVITDNSSAPLLKTGLKLLGSNVDDEVNVFIGSGAASMTTIAGDLDIDGDEITTAGNLDIDCGGILKLDAHTITENNGIHLLMAGTKVGDINVHHSGTYFRMFENGGASTNDYFDIGVAANGASTIRTWDAATANQAKTTGHQAHLIFSVDGHIKFQVTGVGFLKREASFSTSAVIGDGNDSTDIDFREGNKFELVLTDNISGSSEFINMIFPDVSGNFVLAVRQDGTGSRTVASGGWVVYQSDGATKATNSAGSNGTDGEVRWQGGSAPTLTTGANKTDIIAIYWDNDDQTAFAQASLNF